MVKKTATGQDVFLAYPDEPGNYFFQVYDSQSQAFTGGPGDDEFHFRLSAARFSENRGDSPAAGWPVDIVLKGAGGDDGIIFLAEESMQQGVTAHLSTHSRPLSSFFSTQGSAGRLQLIDIENATGTPYDDRLSSSVPHGSTLNGNGGMDTLTGGDGDDTLMAEHGRAAGNKGQDTYILLENQVNGQLYIQENTAEEYSTILLPCALSQIQAIYQDSTDLCLNFDNGNGTISTLRLGDFYHNIPENTLASQYDIHSRDGFSFQLTAGTKFSGVAPEQEQQTSVTTADDGQHARQDETTRLIQVRYHMENDRTLRAQEVKEIIFYHQDELHATMINTHNTRGHVSEVRRLPAFFQLALYGLQARRSELYGAGEADMLLAQAGSASLMRGNGGADRYVVVATEQSGPLYIDNRDTAIYPAQDTLILPWQFNDITWSALPGGVKGVHESHRNAASSVRQEVYLTFMDEAPHLCVQDSNGDIRYFERHGDGLITLANGPLNMNNHDRLELDWSSGRVVLDGRTRLVGSTGARPTVILDKSGAGNHLYGTVQISNIIQAVAGNNVIQGGDMADYFYSGTGNDIIDGQGDRDWLHFTAGNGHDTLSGVEIVEFPSEVKRDSVHITGIADTATRLATVRLNFEGTPGDSLTFTNYHAETIKQVELHFTSHKGTTDIIQLAELMAAQSEYTGWVDSTTETVFAGNQAGYITEIISPPVTSGS